MSSDQECYFCGSTSTLAAAKIVEGDTTVHSFICLPCSLRIERREEEYVCAKCEKPLRECKCQ